MAIHEQINCTPLRDALTLAGFGDQIEGRMLYQDYLNIVQGAGQTNVPPISEHQWEQMCDMLGGTVPMYASNVKMMLDNGKRKQDA